MSATEPNAAPPSCAPEREAHEHAEEHQARTLSIAGAALPTYSLDGLPVFVPVRVQGSEAIGRIDACRYLVTLRTDDAYAFSPSVTANLDLDKVVGTEVTLSIQLEGKGEFVPGVPGGAGLGNIGAGVREITGLVEAVRIAGEDRHSILYELELRPWLYRATLTQDCRIFQDMSVIEITDAVLARYPYTVDKRLAGVFRGIYPKRDVQRQAFESDWAFLQRLWEEWGIWWWFDHDNGFHRLVLCDTMGGHRRHGPAYETLRYLPPSGKRIDEEHIHALSVTSRLTPGRVSVVDYDYTRPRANTRVTEENPRATGSADGEIYDWGDYGQPLAGAQGLAGEPNDIDREARHFARVQLQAQRCAGLRAHGKGNLRGLRVGYTFELTGYPQQAANREYVVVSCAFDIEDIGDRAGAGRAYRCEAEFELLPSNEPFRLARSMEKPRLSGPEKAIVVGPAGQEIWTDKLGRVKAQFAWDRHGKLDEHAGIWLRVLSPWQGVDMGATFIPRIGHEVAVMHYYGDPDLPVIAGSLVNAFREPALNLPDNHAVSVLRGRELKGGDSGHVAIDDTQGQIQTQITSDAGTSQLSLGNIRRILPKKGRADPRGQGFDLRTDYWGVVRALKGLFVTTDGQAGGPGHAKDAREAVARLTQARDVQESLADLAQHHGAQLRQADQSEVARKIKKQNDAIRGGAATPDQPFPEFSSADMVLASADGAAVTAARSVHVAAGEHIALTSVGHIAIAAGRSIFASVRETFSLFAKKSLSLIAGTGKVKIQAQQNDVEIIAKQVLELISTSDSIRLSAAKNIELKVNNTTVRLGPDGFEVLTIGKCHLRAGDLQSFGPQAEPLKLPGFVSMDDTRGLTRAYHDDEPVQGARFDIDYDDGSQYSALLDAAGHADLTHAPDGNGLIRFGADERDWQAKVEDASRMHAAKWSEYDFAASANKNSKRPL
ncbi:type VI secretion system Vgr family protein [Trinickia sp.]|uniref:type VI secretion system Vgr family protein n=1 Tax=Trinickia sp. TaxID=2571163 RepID=UPI003F804DC6